MGGALSMCICSENDAEQGHTSSPDSRNNGKVTTDDLFGEEPWARRKVFAASRLRDGRDGGRARQPRRSVKKPEDRALIRRAVLDCTLLGALPNKALEEIIDFMVEITLRPGEPCEVGDCLCVVLLQ